VEKPSSTDVLLLSRLHQSLIASSKTVASPCRARTLSTELDFGVALTEEHNSYCPCALYFLSHPATRLSITLTPFGSSRK